MSNSITKISLGRIGLKAGLITFAVLVVYFLFMRMTGMTGNAAAWSFNFIILFGGIIYCYRYYRDRTELNVDYLPGMMLGAEVTAVCVLLYSLFVYIYFLTFDPAALNELQGNVLFMTDEVSPLKAASASFIEGLSSGIVISFIMMQYYKSGFKRSSKAGAVKG